MKHKLSVVIFLLGIGQFIDAQLPFAGNCPAVNPMTDFDVDAYMGTWYEQTKYPFLFELGKRCIYAKYNNQGSNTISVLNASIGRFTGQPSNINGYAKVLGPGRLAVVFAPGQSETQENYVVLRTDYDNYAVVYSCTNFSGLFNARVVWILTRERFPSPAVMAKAKRVMDENNLSQRFLTDTDQNNCPSDGNVKLFDVSDNSNDIVSV